jgi:small subunit ribosomal protein S20
LNDNLSRSKVPNIPSWGKDGEKGHRKACHTGTRYVLNLWRITKMANIKSQVKRNKQNENKRMRNRVVRGSTRTAVNKARTAVAEQQENSEEMVLKAIIALDKAVQKGVIHKNNAARKKSRLMKKLAAGK